jgi:hypothetical protein
MDAHIDKLSWGVAGLCLVGALAFPAAAPVIWIAGVAVLLPFLWMELRKPVNYLSLEFDTQGFRFVDGSNRASGLRWNEVREVYYRRLFCPFANQIETEWEFHGSDGQVVVVLVEWPHRKPFAQAVSACVPGMSPEEVSKVLRFRNEGRWKCGAVNTPDEGLDRCP